MRQLTTELTSDNPQITAEALDLIRQLSLVNMYFFLRYIASYSGPFDKLTPHLHAEMCNVRQSWLEQGTRGAALLPRSFFKSSIFTIGGNTWELLRNPDLRICIVSSIVERSYEFMWTTQRVFDSNELIKVLFPEYVPRRGESGKILSKRWNDREMTMPNRTIQHTSSSIKCIGAGAASAGIHVDLLNVDDIVGDHQLNVDRLASAEMQKADHWLSNNEETLLDDPKQSRIVLCATRYSLEDPYERVYKNSGKRLGYWKNLDYEENPTGRWTVYHREVEENGVYVFPEKIDKETFANIQRKDPWLAMTQYYNRPHNAILAELSDYEVPECTVTTHPQTGEWTIEVMGTDENGSYRPRHIFLSDCDIVLTIDPAASESKTRQGNSRSALCLLAHAPNNKKYIIEIRAGYFSASVLFDNIFAVWRKYTGLIRATVLEAQGAFKLLGPLLQQEQNKRNTWINLRTVNKSGEKDAGIRHHVQPCLERGELYCEKNAYLKLQPELRTFPQGKLKDILDALSLGLQSTSRPDTVEEREKYELYLHRQKLNDTRNSTTGY